MENGYYTWMLVSASLVLLMTAPGLALFYGGMSRTKSVLNMMMMSFSALGVVGIVYALWGWSMSYSTTFATSGGATGKEIGKLFSNPFTQFGLESTDPANYVFVAFQLTFAVITAALISGAVADRMKFSAWLVFLPIWVTLSYFPLAHMVWGGGFLSGVENGLADLLFPGDGGAEVAPIDYAGGTVVHINAGVAGLVLALLLGRRLGFGKEPMKPHNLTLTMIGAGLLWFGWFGFNVGSIVNLDDYTTETGLVWLNTTLATCAAMMGWLLVEKLRDGHATSLGAASGVVAGLVAITPACGNLVPWSSIVLGLVAGGVCALAVGLKYRFGYDDSLDVVGVHLVGGLIGTIGVGFLASHDGGLLTGGGAKQLVVQVLVAAFAMVWSAIATLVVGLGIKAVMGLRLPEEDEVDGIDFAEHGEAAYDLTTGGGAARRTSLLSTTSSTPSEVSA
ncbi:MULTISPECIES: ammonium transporter [unclassified Nocardioides]|uniref:ammonium transporter n=1 Tax=unclassified Nocardioides TaxID=2615069 RepID=UPI00116C74CF|nr:MULTISPECIES: ammonium transporter [unclassified Nocardioides]TQK72081.1 ammonium transporter [Nocardioides sp. SLBN-35]WGY03709.1 ammonium transporter [Nocardioides sp. QY071]